MSNNLAGLRILNTRPQEQAQLLSEQIRNAGGVSVECPTLEITSTGNQWINELPSLAQVQYALFISANAVNYCFRSLKVRHIAWPNHIHVVAIGESTANALKHYQVDVHDIPAAPDSEHVLALQRLQKLKHQNVLIFKGEGGRPLIEDVLKQRKAHVITLSVYKRIMPSISPQFIQSLWRDDAVDIILLTSEQAMKHCFQLFGQEANHWLKSKPYLVISQRLAQIATSYGINTIIVSHPNKIMDALLDYKGSLYGQ